jgi:uncharacterized membrane protein (DUF485 family)
MKPDQIQDILDHPHFKQLVHKKRVLSWTLAAIMLVLYFGYILLVAFVPELLHRSLSGGVTTLGIPLGISVILGAFLLCGIYVWRANGELDTLNKLLRDEVKL